MTCKYYSKEKVGYMDEIGGGVSLPQKIADPHCIKGRKPDYSGWAKKCLATPPEGPCWWWQEENPDLPDPLF